MKKLTAFSATGLLLLAACTTFHPGEVSPVWMGEWTGPEGTSLVLRDLGNNDVEVQVTNLDGPRVFAGRVSDDRDAIVFVRDGISEAIHPGTGTETGMKWLADKTNCLVVKQGEGYCRS